MADLQLTAALHVEGLHSVSPGGKCLLRPQVRRARHREIQGRLGLNQAHTTRTEITQTVKSYLLDHRVLWEFARSK